MANVFFRLVRSNADVVEDREFVAQVGETENGPWTDISPWLPTRLEAKAFIEERMRGLYLQRNRRNTTVVDTFSGGTTL